LCAKDLYPEKEQAVKAWRDFVNTGAAYLHYNSKERTFTGQNLDMTPAQQALTSDPSEILKTHVNTFLVVQNKEMALTLFSFLLQRLNLNYVDSDFQFTCDGGPPVRERKTSLRWGRLM
jgi:hypothetical protein